MRKGRLLAALAVVLVATVALAPAVWAVPGIPISNFLKATLTEEEEPKDSPTITIHDDLSSNSIVGLWDVFRVSTEPGDYGNETVRVKIQLSGGATDGFELEYVDDDGDFKPLPFDGDGVAWFGPAEGFPLAQQTSVFRVTWLKPGSYKANVSIMTGDNFGTVLESDSVEVDVAPEGHAIRLNWIEGSEDKGSSIERTYKVGEEFTLSARASLDSGVSHVDGVLYIIEVKKGDTPATPDDLTVTGTGGQALGYNQDGGYFFWGPHSGFTFGCVGGAQPPNQCAPDGSTTTFTVTITNGGTYSVEAYAVQLDPQGAAAPQPGN